MHRTWQDQQRSAIPTNTQTHNNDNMTRNRIRGKSQPYITKAKLTMQQELGLQEITSIGLEPRLFFTLAYIVVHIGLHHITSLFTLAYIMRQVMTSPGGSIRPRQEKGGGQEELEAI